jgi:hypothetical protein
MTKRGNKRGQFYLVAGMIIAALIITIATVSNYSKINTSPGLEVLKEEIQIESSRVLDYGTNNQLSSSAMKQTLLDFSDNYTDFIGTGKSIYFIFGNTGEITLSGYQEVNREVLLDSTLITSTIGSFEGSIVPTGSNVNLAIDGIEYDFEINPGENFYFVLSDLIGNEEYIVQG